MEQKLQAAETVNAELCRCVEEMKTECQESRLVKENLEKLVPLSSKFRGNTLWCNFLGENSSGRQSYAAGGGPDDLYESAWHDIYLPEIIRGHW
ncbi:hypothetical protein K1719_024121 [Acacia pycnantha]|nr:hypothetical protein K1719_024121 [Acacia pycnantha]